ncbi:MAG TPA: hypothetical protein VMU10_08965 [Desulfomonilia bacterium]|nr:hypothetical protein [Desulfomonilia bacterium]
MRVSAEVRWFWKNSVPETLRSWFDRGPYPPGGGLLRVDKYLLDPSQTELSIKNRGGKPWVEIKGLVATLERPVRIFPFSGYVQLWSKWSTTAFHLDGLPTVSIHKTRLLRKFDTSSDVIREIALKEDELPADPGEGYPVPGCNVELTQVRVYPDENLWWTFGCEAYGGLESVERSLHRTLEHLAAAGAPQLHADRELCYPAWIKDAVNKKSAP